MLVLQGYVIGRKPRYVGVQVLACRNRRLALPAGCRRGISGCWFPVKLCWAFSTLSLKVALPVQFLRANVKVRLINLELSLNPNTKVTMKF